MRQMGYCPSGRLFEAAACGTPLLSDDWEGLARFYEPGLEILVANNGDDTAAALELPLEALRQIAIRARERTLDEHTAEHRARYLEGVLERTFARRTEGELSSFAESQAYIGA